MKFIKPIFYVIVTVLLLAVVSYVYFAKDSAGSGANLGLILSYILLAAAAAASIIFPIVAMIQNPKSGVRALIGVAAIGVIFLIGYALAGNEITIAYEKVGVTSATVSQLVGGALNLMFITLAAIVGATIFSEVRNLLK